MTPVTMVYTFANTLLLAGQASFGSENIIYFDFSSTLTIARWHEVNTYKRIKIQ